MKRRIVLEVDDDITTAQMILMGGCEDAFGLSMYVCNDDPKYPDMRPRALQAMEEFGITVIRDERIA